MRFGRLLGIAFAIQSMASTSFSAEGNPTSVKFSVFLTPRETEGELRELDELAYFHGETLIPLRLKEGRQSILYPYVGGSKILLYPKDSPSKEEATPVLEINIPGTAKSGVIILQAKENRYKATPFWLDKAQLKKSGYLVNLTGQTLGLQMDKSKRRKLTKGETLELTPKFAADENHAYLYTEIFVPRQGSDPTRYRKILEQNLFFPQGRTQLNLLLPKGERALRHINLSALGVPNRQHQTELETLIPALKAKSPSPR